MDTSLNQHYGKRYSPSISVLIACLFAPWGGSATCVAQDFTRNVKVNEPDADDPNDPWINNARTQSEVSLAGWMHPLDPNQSMMVLAWNDSRDRAIDYPFSQFADWARSADRGRTWTDMPSLPLEGLAGIRGDPVVLADSGGRFYLIQVVNVPGVERKQIALFRSTVGVTGWERAYVIPAQANADADKPWATIGWFTPPGGAAEERLYVAYVQGALWLARAKLGGSSLNFSSIFVDSNSQGPYVDVDHNGDVYIAWLNNLVPRKIRVARSTDGGVSRTLLTDIHGGTYGALARIGDCQLGCANCFPALPAYDGDPVEPWHNGIRANQHPRLLVDRDTDNLYVVFAEGSWTDPCQCAGTGPDEATIKFARSTDNGQSWEAPLDLIALSSGAPEDVTDQWDPTMCMAPASQTLPNGLICVMSNDKRRDLQENVAFDLYYMLSGDAGISFTQPRRVTQLIGVAEPENLPSPVPQPLCEPMYDPLLLNGYMGDYNQVVYHDGCFLSGWGDNRYEFGHIEEPGGPATPTPDPDVFFAKRRAVLLYGDFDLDCDVDLTDYLHFQECFAGEDVPVPPGCLDADFDCEGDVDLADFDAFNENFTGSGPGCGQGGNAAMGDPPSPEIFDRLVDWSRAELPAPTRRAFAEHLAAIGATHPDPQYGRLLEAFAAAIR